tara:strand:- start:60 stop:2588 length:2529 start_codon:yes stop_codon:yes gene_type:complete
MWKFIKYSFNKAFEKDLLYLIIFFLFLSFIGVTAISTLIFVLQELGVLSENNFYTETLWQGFRLFFVTEAFFSLDDKNTFLDYFFKFNITIFGILIFSSIIGIITNLISNRIEELRTGKTKIEEENHIIFFNFSRRLIPLLTELCKAYENEKQSFVVVSNEEPLVVMEKIKNVIKIPKNITILARKGYAWQKSLLDKINLEKAKQVIILKPDINELFKTEMDCDVEVGKSVSSIIGSKEYNKKPCKIFSEFHNEKSGLSHLMFSMDIWGKKIGKVGNDYVPELVSSQELKSDILSQCTNTPDLTEIYDNLFGYEGSEIYFVDPDKSKFKEVLNKNIGKNIKDLNRLCDNIIVIGFFYKDQNKNKVLNKIFLNTPINFPLTKNFGIICIAENEDQIIKELNELESHEKEVKDIDPNFKQDDQDLNISLLDFSKEKDKEYLTKIVGKLVSSNYYNNLKKIDIYHNEKVDELNNINFSTKINSSEENELINLGIIFHRIDTDHEHYYKFQVYKVNQNSPLYSKIKPADEILNIIKKKDLKKNLDEKEYCIYTKWAGGTENKFKIKLNNILNENDEIIIILKKYDTGKIEFLEISKTEVLDCKTKILKEFDKIESKKKSFQEDIKINTIQKNLDKLSEDITNIDKVLDYNKEFEQSNCIILLNESNQQIQKFRENPIEDHAMINNFVGFSRILNDQSLITEVNGYRTKKILEDFKYKYFSPTIGNDVVEINSIISKYIAAATFDMNNSDLINLLFKRAHTLKSHTLLDKSLSTTFCELEKYFQSKNEVLIGIIDYDFYLSKRKIKSISINPEQKKQIDLDEGDRLITIANFNDLEMIKGNRHLHIL